MIDKRFFTVFLLMFIFTGIISFLVWRVFLLEKKVEVEQIDKGCTYEDIDFNLPVKAFLKRCAASKELSYVRRLFVNQWISSNQKDLATLIMYAQGATNYEEMKKAFINSIEKEPSKTSAAKFITNAIDIIDKNLKLIEHVNSSLQQGYSQAIHSLRGEIMQSDKDGKEYKRLKNEYKKELYKWIDEKHGNLLDEIIAKL
ncbi:hypothetical protein HYV10_01515 [Candidatus Dependentiae bacterium]|nr:hypothetical protein [Candidatus Dependentiae bacterium]